MVNAPPEQKKKLMVLGAVAVAILLTVVVVVKVGPGSYSSASASGAKVGINDAVGVVDGRPEILRQVGRIAAARERRSYAGSEHRDPMVALATDGGEDDGYVPPPKKAPERLPDMVLEGIIWDTEKPVALIDGSEYRTGESVKGATIVSIGFNEVTLSYRSKTYVKTVE
jgi:hypothetical protein